MPVNQNTNEDQLTGALRVLYDALKKDVENCIPCKILSVNATRTRVTVQPLIKIVTYSGEQITRKQIANIPVFNAGAGDFVISFPIKAGDLGWIESSDRDISLFLQNYSDSIPATDRKHSFSDARFIPDIMRNFTIDSEDNSALIIQIRDNTVKISMDSSQIRIQNNDARIELDSNAIHATTSSVDILIDGSSVTGVAPGGFDLNGFTIDASGAAVSPVSITAPITNTATLAATTSITKAGVEVADGQHTHNAGTYVVGSDPVTGTSAVSNG